MMRLGTRWSAGGDPPSSVPAELRKGIAQAEADLPAGERAGWTLTWLEGRPIAELDTGVEVTIGPDGNAVVRKVDEDG